jgi:antitoxin YefM
MKIAGVMSITEARKRIFEIAEAVQKNGKHITLTEKGRASAVIMSAEQYESWVETLEVLSDFPNIHQEIQSARQDFINNKFVSLDDVRRTYGRKK